MNFNWPPMTTCRNIAGIDAGGFPMSDVPISDLVISNLAISDMADQNIERLSHLFASGNLSHAREIARRLGEEIGERPHERCESGLISRFLAAAAFGK